MIFYMEILPVDIATNILETAAWRVVFVEIREMRTTRIVFVAEASVLDGTGVTFGCVLPVTLFKPFPVCAPQGEDASECETRTCSKCSKSSRWTEYTAHATGRTVTQGVFRRRGRSLLHCLRGWMPLCVFLRLGLRGWSSERERCDKDRVKKWRIRSQCYSVPAPGIVNNPEWWGKGLRVSGKIWHANSTIFVSKIFQITLREVNWMVQLRIR